MADKPTYEELEQRVSELEGKMEAIVTLAGGIAHDCNKLLTGIHDRTSSMLMDIDYEHPYFDHLREIESMVRRCADLVGQLLELPVSEKEVAEEKKLSGEAAIKKGMETVLFVDDEDMVIDVGREMLGAMGYRVLVAGGGREATEIYRKNMGRIDIVIMDMVMPDMGGGETYDLLKEINPDVKVLLASGYSIDGQATEILKRGCNGFIQKPFSIKALSQKIREILDGK